MGNARVQKEGHIMELQFMLLTGLLAASVFLTMLIVHFLREE